MNKGIPATLQSIAPHANEAYYHIDEVHIGPWKPGSITFE